MNENFHHNDSTEPLVVDDKSGILPPSDPLEKVVPSREQKQER